MEEAVSREDLIRLVSDPEVGEAGAICAASLRAGADFTTFPDHERPVDLVGIYQRRTAIARQRGIPTVGGDDLVARIAGQEQVAVGMVKGQQHNVAVFLVAQGARCAACWAVPNDWTPAE